MIAIITRRRGGQWMSIGIGVFAFCLVGNPLYATEAVDNLIATVTQLHQESGFSKVNTMVQLVVRLQTVDSLIEGGHTQGATGMLTGMSKQIKGWAQARQVTPAVMEAMLPQIEALQLSLSESKQPGAQKGGKKP